MMAVVSEIGDPMPVHKNSVCLDDNDGDSCGSDVDVGIQRDINSADAVVEERFRVDRRKLEQMIQGPSQEFSMTAEDFFLQVMEETDTQVTWPSRLRIGAKSKKDPYIKVVGTCENVSAAKEKIMAVLDSKSTRVTLKMDVSHMEHSHVIGKGGCNIKQVMQESGCHIHFPDSNRNNQAEKSNQVSIAGQPLGVEMARVKIRELLPLIFLFELPVSALLVDLSSPVIQQIQQRYDVTVSFKQRPQAYITTMMVRGTVRNAKAVRDATALLIEHLTGNAGHAVAVSMQIEIAPQHHLFMMGKGGANVRQIMQHTGASIHFPDPSTVHAQRRGVVYVTGLIESVYQARQQLIGCLPLILMFDVKEDVSLNQALITHLMERLDVFISIKQKPKQLSKLVIVKSVEHNAASLHLARQKILGGDVDGLFPLPQTLGGYNERPMPSMPPPASPGPAVAANMAYHNFGMLSHSPVFGGMEQNPMIMVGGGGGLVRPMHVGSGLVSPIPNAANHLAPNMNSMGSPLPSAANQFSAVTQGTAVTTPGLYSPVMVFGSPPYTASNFSTFPGQSVAASAAAVSSLFNAPARSANQNMQPVGTPGLPHVERVIVSVGSLRSSSDSTSSSPSSTSSGQQGQGQGQTSDLSGNQLSSSIGLRPIVGRSASQSHEASLNDTLSSLLTKGPTMTPYQSQPVSCLVDVARQYSRDSEAVSAANDRSLLDLLMSRSGAVPSSRVSMHHPSAAGLSHRSSSSMDLYGGRSAFVAAASAAGSMTAPGSPLASSRTSLVDPGLTRGTDIGWQNRFDGTSNSKWPKLGMENDLLAGCNIFDELDYENKKLLANKAMSKKPSGESRVPTDFWSGLGFSKSMPDTAIRERLRESNVAQAAAALPSSLEVDETELDMERWADLSARNGGGAMFEYPPMLAKDPASETTNDSSLFLPGSMSAVSAAPGGFPSPRKKGSDLAGLSRSNYIDNSVIHHRIDYKPSTDLAELFSKLGLGKYTDLFQQQEIDLATFMTLTDQDLKELGITTFGARRKMLLAVADLSKRQSLMSAAPGSNNPHRNTNNTNGQSADSSVPW